MSLHTASLWTVSACCLEPAHAAVQHPTVLSAITHSTVVKGATLAGQLSARDTNIHMLLGIALILQPVWCLHCVTRNCTAEG